MSCLVIQLPNSLSHPIPPFLLNAACLAEKHQIPISVFGLTQSVLEPTIYHTCGEHANHYTTNEPTIYHTCGKQANHYTLKINMCKWLSEVEKLETNKEHWSFYLQYGDINIINLHVY
jgi:hypothetical protein